MKPLWQGTDFKSVSNTLTFQSNDVFKGKFWHCKMTHGILYSLASQYQFVFSKSWQENCYNPETLNDHTGLVLPFGEHAAFVHLCHKQDLTSSQTFSVCLVSTHRIQTQALLTCHNVSDFEFQVKFTGPVKSPKRNKSWCWTQNCQLAKTPS